MSTDDKKEKGGKIIRIFPQFVQEEFSYEDTAWESMVDLCLQDHMDYIERLTTHYVDLQKEVDELRETLTTLLLELHKERKKNGV